MAQGRDAADVAISTNFGAAQLARFSVVTEEIRNESNTPTAANRVPNQSTLTFPHNFQFA